MLWCAHGEVQVAPGVTQIFVNGQHTSRLAQAVALAALIMIMYR
jgi:hypothetical protein